LPTAVACYRQPLRMHNKYEENKNEVKRKSTNETRIIQRKGILREAVFLLKI
jgi:hypothetical protein